MQAASQSTQLTIGARLRRALGVRKMSLRTFAEATGIPYRTLQDYVADKRKPGSDHSAKMAGAGIDLNWLIAGAPSGTGAGTAATAVAGDADLTEALYKHSLAAMDEYLKQDLPESMSFAVLLAVQQKLYAELVALANSMADKLAALRQRGMATAFLVDIIVDAFSRRVRSGTSVRSDIAPVRARSDTSVRPETSVRVRSDMADTEPRRATSPSGEIA